MTDEEENLHSTGNDFSLVNDEDVDDEEAYLEVYDSGNDENSNEDAWEEDNSPLYCQENIEMTA